jgi:glycine cleavage system H protein
LPAGFDSAEAPVFFYLNAAFSCRLFLIPLRPAAAITLKFRCFLKGAELMPYPQNYRYTREHEWISVEGSTGTVGITDYAQNSLGDIVYVDAPKVGDSVSANATFGSVESVKAVSDLYSPVSGKVTAVNEALKNEPDKINQDPHSTWIIKVELSNPAELEKLLDAAAYEAFISEETEG